MATRPHVPVSLRVFGDTLEPDEVSALLGREPTRCHRKGDACADDASRRERTGAWILDSALDETAELEEHVEALFAHLSNDEDEWASLTTRFSASIVCRVVPARQGDGLDLSPRLARSLADRGLVITFEFGGGATQAHG